MIYIEQNQQLNLQKFQLLFHKISQLTYYFCHHDLNENDGDNTTSDNNHPNRGDNNHDDDNIFTIIKIFLEHDLFN